MRRDYRTDYRMLMPALARIFVRRDRPAVRRK